MSKEEQYDALLAHLSRTGQGVPVKILKRYPANYDWSLTEELINEGKLTIVPAWEGCGTEHLIINDDKYFRAEVDDPNVTTIELMRHYLGIMKDDEIVPIYNLSVKELIDKNKESYTEWLNKYKHKLDALIELKEKIIKQNKDE